MLLSPELAEFESALAMLQRAFGQIAAGQATPQEAMDRAQDQFE